MAKKKAEKKEETGLTLFGVDLSPFSKVQQQFLINFRYARTRADCAKSMGISRSTVTAWEKKPEFKQALRQITAVAMRVDATEAENPHIVNARAQALDILADATPGAALELKNLTDTPWKDCTDRGKSTKLKGIEDVLRITGVESKHKAGSGKIDITQIIMELIQENAEKPIDVIGEVT